MRSRFVTFLKDVAGATAIEYGLLAAGIAVAILTSVSTVGCSLTGLFTDLAQTVQSL